MSKQSPAAEEKPVFPSPTSAEAAIGANQQAYTHHMALSAAHTRVAARMSGRLGDLLQEIADRQAEAKMLEVEHRAEETAARVESERAAGFELVLKAIGAPVPPPPPADPLSQQADVFGGPRPAVPPENVFRPRPFVSGLPERQEAAFDRFQSVIDPKPEAEL